MRQRYDIVNVITQIFRQWLFLLSISKLVNGWFSPPKIRAHVDSFIHEIPDFGQPGEILRGTNLFRIL